MDKSVKELQILVIGNIPYIIDLEKREFRQYNYPSNVIAFDSLKDEDEYLTMRYELGSKGVSNALAMTDKGSPEVIDVTIPNVIIKNDQPLPENIINLINKMSVEREWGIFAGDECLASRLAGALPHMDIAGCDFTIDGRLRELRETAAPWNSLAMDDMEPTISGDHYRFFFDTNIHTRYEPDLQMTALPKNVVMVEIPNELALDPVGVARGERLHDLFFLPNYPIQKNLLAVIKPLSASGLPDLVARNLSAKQEKSKQQKNSRRRGHGI